MTELTVGRVSSFPSRTLVSEADKSNGDTEVEDLIIIHGVRVRTT